MAQKTKFHRLIISLTIEAKEGIYAVGKANGSPTGMESAVGGNFAGWLCSAAAD